jgi:hypothetical protein
MGLGIENSDTAMAILYVEGMETDSHDLWKSIEKTSLDLPHGLINFKLGVENPGDAATVTIHLPEAAPVAARWMKYDPLQGIWLDYTGYAEFSEDRMAVALEFVDGGFGDGDGAANGIIVDPAGIDLSMVVEKTDTVSSLDTGSADSGSGDNNENSGGDASENYLEKVGCFITVCMADKTASLPITAVIILIVISGTAAVVRRTCKREV